jgi:hypothetical protein
MNKRVANATVAFATQYIVANATGSICYSFIHTSHSYFLPRNAVKNIKSVPRRLLSVSQSERSASMARKAARGGALLRCGAS